MVEVTRTPQNANPAFRPAEQQPKSRNSVAVLLLIGVTVLVQYSMLTSGTYNSTQARAARELQQQQKIAAAAAATTAATAAPLHNSESITSNETQHYKGLSIVGAFNHVPDLHRRQTKPTEPSLDYIKQWYDSVQGFPDIDGVVLTTMYNETFIKDHERDNVKFVTINQTDPSFLSHMHKSLNDQRFYMIQDYLENVATNAEYILISDARDVNILRNPFEFMRKMDTMLGGEHQLYIQEGYETAPVSVAWAQEQWQNCFHHNFRLRRTLIAGILGGHRDILLPFVKSINTKLDRVPKAAKICDQAVIQSLAHFNYADKIISGYPFNSRFKAKQNASQTKAYIAHK